MCGCNARAHRPLTQAASLSSQPAIACCNRFTLERQRRSSGSKVQNTHSGARATTSTVLIAAAALDCNYTGPTLLSVSWIAERMSCLHGGQRQYNKAGSQGAAATPAPPAAPPTAGPAASPSPSPPPQSLLLPRALPLAAGASLTSELPPTLLQPAPPWCDQTGGAAAGGVGVVSCQAHVRTLRSLLIFEAHSFTRAVAAPASSSLFSG